MIHLIIIYCLLFFILAYKRLDIAIYVVVAALPSYLIRFEFFNIPMTLLEAMILILGVVWVIKRGYTRIPPPSIWIYPILAILTFSTISAIISPAGASAWGIWKAYFIEPILFFLVIIPILPKRRGAKPKAEREVANESPTFQGDGIARISKKHIKNIFWALGVSALYLSIYAICQKFTGFGVPAPYLNAVGGVNRVVGPFLYPNALGLYLGPIIILFTGFFFLPLYKEEANKSLTCKSDGIRRGYSLLKLTIILLSFITLILAKSEGAIITVVMAWLFMMCFYKKTRKIALAVILIFVILFFANPAINTMIMEKITFVDYSVMVRKLIWTESWQMLKDNWFLGAGLAGYPIKIAPYHLPTFEIFLYPHNIILNFWSELGILGLLSFIWLIILFFKQIIVETGQCPVSTRVNRILSITLTATMLQIIIHGLVDVPYFKNDLAVLFWLVMAISVIVNDNNIKYNNDTN